MKWLIVFLFAISAVFPLAVWASEGGVAVKNCQVLDEPFADAKEIASLKVGDPVEIVARKGGWFNIATRGKTGWVRMLFVRRGAAAGKTSAITEASGVLGLATGRAGKGNVVAATGVRGLNEEELKSATYNTQEFTKLKTYATTNAEARSFAKEGGLRSQPVDFLDAAAGN